MNRELFGEVAAVLIDKFQVDPSLVHPETTLESLGLDSLSLMEFVFAVEDRLSTRIPEEKLDPRQAGLTLASLVQALDDELLAPSTSRAAAS